MTSPVYANEEHKQAVESYVNACKEFIKDISTKTRYNNYLDVVEIILEYHNNYGKTTKSNNFHDWLMIIPINISVATNGYFAAIETKKNASTVRAYKILLEQLSYDTVDKIQNLTLHND